jgi:hypothetical protein
MTWATRMGRIAQFEQVIHRPNIEKYREDCIDRSANLGSPVILYKRYSGWPSEVERPMQYIIAAWAIFQRCFFSDSSLIATCGLVAFLCSGALTLAPAQVEMPSTQSSNVKPQIRRTFPLTKFYDTPNLLPPGKSGELIRKEEFDEYDLAAGVLAVRILYHSRSARGEDVATSGVVLYPEGKAPPSGWPVIAWAHPLNGVARQCAPSLVRNLRHGPFLSMYVNLGYAVVATDYTGLGTNFRNAFADMPSNAADVIYSIPAAQAAVPQLGSRWVAIGSGEGSLAVVGVAELQRDIRDPNYLGGIIISGLTDLQDRYEHPDVGALLFLAYGVKTVYPEFDPRDMLTDKALALFPRVEDGCGESEMETPLSASETMKPNWENKRFVKQYFSRNRADQRPAFGALLAIASEADPNDRTAQVIARLCKQGDQVQFEKYAAPDPGSVIGESVRDQISWIQGRFAGRPAPSNCSEQH